MYHGYIIINRPTSRQYWYFAEKEITKTAKPARELETTMSIALRLSNSTAMCENAMINNTDDVIHTRGICVRRQLLCITNNAPWWDRM